MHTFILVHGAWHGGDVWQPLVKELQTVGKQASTVTLTGLGERKHLLSDTIDLETHIQDVVGHIESQAFDEVTLVGWSYGGMVIAGVLPRITQRVKAMVLRGRKMFNRHCSGSMTGGIVSISMR